MSLQNSAIVPQQWFHMSKFTILSLSLHHALSLILSLHFSMFRGSCSHPWLFHQETSLPCRVRKPCKFRLVCHVKHLHFELGGSHSLFHEWPLWPLKMTVNRWVDRKGSVSATAATSCATPPPPSSPPSPPSPPSSHPSSSFSPFPSPSPPFLPSYPPPSSSLWPISRQIRLLLLQGGVNSARGLYHNYFAFRTKHMLQLVFHTEIKDFL